MWYTSRHSNEIAKTKRNLIPLYSQVDTIHDIHVFKINNEWSSSKDLTATFVKHSSSSLYLVIVVTSCVGLLALSRGKANLVSSWKEVGLKIGTWLPPELGSYLPTETGRWALSSFLFTLHKRWLPGPWETCMGHKADKSPVDFFCFCFFPKKDLYTFKERRKTCNDQISKVNTLRKGGKVGFLSSTEELCTIFKIRLSLHFLIMISY